MSPEASRMMGPDPTACCISNGAAPPPGMYETKFVLPLHAAEAAQVWAGGHLRPDPHGAGSLPTYAVHSLYFDTLSREIYRRADTHGLTKYRIRRYDDGPVLFLERKAKHQGRVWKHRTRIPAVELWRVAEPVEGWSGSWFTEAIVTRQLEPVCHVSYVRSAWIGELEGQRVRLTLDRSLRGGQAGGLRIPGSTVRGLPLVAGCVLEFKCEREVPLVFRRLMAQEGWDPASMSKFRRAMEQCGMAPA